jgi:hypothetical protein
MGTDETQICRAKYMKRAKKVSAVINIDGNSQVCFDERINKCIVIKSDYDVEA